jgi:hypothetical protein
MPYYSFDLVLDEEFKTQGSIILENLRVASDKADQLANELSQVRPELKAKGCSVRVTDADNTELYRTPLDGFRRAGRFSGSSAVARRAEAEGLIRQRLSSRSRRMTASKLLRAWSDDGSNDQAANRRSNSAGA